MAYVYRHIRLDKNEPFYVGIGSDPGYKRSRTKKYRNDRWHKVVGKTDYRVDIIYDEISWEDALKKEIEFINLYGRLDLNQGTLVNMTDGGVGQLGVTHNRKHSEETKKKIGEKAKGRFVSAETRLKLSGVAKGSKRSSETKKKMSEIRIGMKFSDEHKENIGKSRIGKKLPKMSEESKEKMSKHHRFLPKQKKGLSSYKGVSYMKDVGNRKNRKKRWLCALRKNRVTLFQAYFETEKEAAIAYNEAVCKYLSGDAYLNIIK